MVEVVTQYVPAYDTYDAAVRPLFVAVDGEKVALNGDQLVALTAAAVTHSKQRYIGRNRKLPL